MLYKPAKVTPVGTTAALNTVAFVNGGDTAPRSRPSLAQAFRVNATGGVFVADVNHLKTKGSACDRAGRPVTARATATSSAPTRPQALATWLAADPTGTGEPDVLILGDLNSYAKEDPIRALEAAGLHQPRRERTSARTPTRTSSTGSGATSTTPSASPSLLAQVTGVAEYHINSDEPSVLDYNTDFKTPGLQVEPVRAGRVPRLRPRPGHRRPLAELGAALGRRSPTRRSACGDGNASLTVTHPTRVRRTTPTRCTRGVGRRHGRHHGRRPAASPLALDAHLRRRRRVHRHGHRHRHPRARRTRARRRSPSSTRAAASWLRSGRAGRRSSARRSRSRSPTPTATAPCRPTSTPIVTVTRNGTTVRHGHGDPGQGRVEVRAAAPGGLAAGTYTVTVTVPETGQTDTGTADAASLRSNG